jgi:hypothetical protein
MLAIQRMTHMPDDVMRERLLFCLTDRALTCYLNKDRSSQSLSSILDDLVNDLAPKMADFKHRQEFRMCVQKEGESVSVFNHNLVSLKLRVQESSMNSRSISDAEMAEQLLLGLNGNLKTSVFGMLAARGVDLSSATHDQVLTAAVATEASTQMSLQHLSPTVAPAKQFPVKVINAVEMDPRASSYPSDDIRIGELLKTVQSLQVSLEEVRRDHSHSNSYSKPDRFRRDFSKPPDRPCRMCTEAGAQGDLMHWHRDCPLLKQAKAMVIGQYKPPPPPASAPKMSTNATSVTAPKNAQSLNSSGNSF